MNQSVFDIIHDMATNSNIHTYICTYIVKIQHNNIFSGKCLSEGQLSRKSNIFHLLRSHQLMKYSNAFEP